jgi:hypothetical protein
MDADSGFHIRIGDWILAAGRLPLEHPFSFSVTGREWLAFEWLSQVGLAALHAAWGLKGVTLASGLIIGVVFAILFRYVLWTGTNPLIGAVAVLVAVSAARVHFWARPHIVTWLFLVIGVWILERDRRANSWTVWWLVPLTALWANLHGGFVVFLMLVGLRAVADPFESGGGWKRARRYCSVVALCAVASCLNPYGLRLHQHIVEVMSARWITGMVDEFRSPTFRTEPMFAFMALLFAAIAVVWPLVERRAFGEVLWILFLAASSLVSVRHAPVFALVAAPIAARELSLWWVEHEKRPVASRLAFGGAHLSIWPFAFALWIALAPGLAWPSDFSSDLFPVTLVNRHAELAGARVFTTDQWSDYLIYKNFPRQRVFVDGQHQYYGEKHLSEYVATIDGQAGWRSPLERFAIEYALCPGKAALATLLRSDGHWRVLDEAGGAVLFTRARP